MLLLLETPETLGVVDVPPGYVPPPKPQPSMYLPTPEEDMSETNHLKKEEVLEHECTREKQQEDDGYEYEQLCLW